MLAESKIMKNVTAAGSPTSSSGTAVTRLPAIGAFSNARNYSTQDGGGSSTSNKKVCKLGGGKEAKKCHKLKVPHCAPVKSIRCGKRKKRAVQCVKKMSPYPSYSESCHEEPYNKPSECKICPYKSEEHPTFKPPKNDYHTSSAAAYRERYDRLKISAEAGNKLKTAARTFLSTIAKGPSKAGQGEKEVKKNEGFSNARQTLQSSTVSLSKEMGAWLNRLQPDDILLPSIVKARQTKHLSPKEGGGKCQKFPFKECTFTLVKKKKIPLANKGKCPEKPKRKPEKPKRKLVKDCPPENEDECKRSAPEFVRNLLTYKMCEQREDENSDKRKKKCPKINLGVCKDEMDNRDDPCGRKRRGKTLICPTDLLKTGRDKNKKKKTSGVIPPTIGQVPPPTPTPRPVTAANM
ncbi:Protein of unknown function (DUF1431) [Popillia japonica]|uniref:Uncharacterized protein n=1 Tax=Popillia japonica TaxID=7064 RepID=A0AAW1MJQ7_POPJA